MIDGDKIHPGMKCILRASYPQTSGLSVQDVKCTWQTHFHLDNGICNRTTVPCYLISPSPEQKAFCRLYLAVILTSDALLGLHVPHAFYVRR